MIEANDTVKGLLKHNIIRMADLLEITLKNGTVIRMTNREKPVVILPSSLQVTLPTTEVAVGIYNLHTYNSGVVYGGS